MVRTRVDTKDKVHAEPVGGKEPFASDGARQARATEYALCKGQINAMAGFRLFARFQQ